MHLRHITLPSEQLEAFCQRWKITEMALFGSGVREDYSAQSDLDILVTFSPEADWGLFDHVRMKRELSELLQKNIDLLSRRAVENSHNDLLSQEILSTSQAIYVA